ncbi:MAG: hypothetical protein R6X34_07515 [Chloroflexota bacterium]
MKKLLFLAISIVLLLVLAGQPYPGHAKKAADSLNFNGDFAADLVIGVPNEAIGNTATAGAAHILYGAVGPGLSDSGSQLWYQGNNGLLDAAEAYDGFGAAFAIGDFDGNGYLDLAVGVPGEGIGSPEIPKAGAVHVLYFSARSPENEIWHQDSAGILDNVEEDDRFGFALAAGDFNGDGYTDLAVGVPYEDVGNPAVSDAGMVQVLYGSASGLSADGDQTLYQGAFNLEDSAEADDRFGSTLAAADFDADGYTDLAIGVHREDIGAVLNAGAVQVLYGAANGINASRDQFWHQDANGVADTAEAVDYFGFSLAVGDANHDGYADLSVGIPREDIGAIANAGAVQIFYGAPSTGLTAEGNWLLHQDFTAVADSCEAEDEFGSSLAGGDFNGDGYSDLAVGVPAEDIGNPVVGNAGAVHIFYSNTGGDNELMYQGHNGFGDTAETNDLLGYSLAAGDFNDDGRTDLAVGVPFENREGVAPLTDAGVVHVLLGSSAGLTTAGSQLWHQDSPGISGASEDNDYFGFTLAAIPSTRSMVYLPLVVR